jgi:hypothetical protein
MKPFKQYIKNKKEVWRDTEGKIVYIRGVPVKLRGGLTHIEWNEAKDMQSGSVIKDNIKYIPPFTKTYE